MKTKDILSRLFFIILLCIYYPGFSQTRDTGPWWPNAEWGPNDQAGASNRITPDKVMEALTMVTSGTIYELGHIYEQGMPMFGNRTYSLVLPAKGPAYGDNRIVGNEEFLSTQIGQVGTQFDGLGHIGQEVQFKNGDTDYVFYNGFRAEEMNAPGGLQKLGIEHVNPIVTRGILIDIAEYKGVERLPNSYEVTVDDLRGALELQSLDETDIEPGDAVILRYGWSTLWTQPDSYNNNPPGIGLEAARWLADKKIVLVGSDSWIGEVVPNPNPGQIYPVHQELMMKNGIFNLENLKLEQLAAENVFKFLLIVTPIQFKGATGSPVRPIAIR